MLHFNFVIDSKFEHRLDSFQYDLLNSQESPEKPDGQKQISSSGSLGSVPHTPLFTQGGVQVLSKFHINKVAEFTKDSYLSLIHI